MKSEQTTSVAERLARLHARLRTHFGYHPQWWPGTPWEIAVSAMLVQQCSWEAAWKAIGRLRAGALLEPQVLARATPESIQRAISGVSFAPTKALRLRSLARFLDGRTIEQFLASGETQTVRKQLLDLPGIGPETADGILLYAGTHATFVVDESLRRSFRRLEILPVDAGFWDSPYAQVQTLFMDNVLDNLRMWEPGEWDRSVPLATAVFRDFHALIVELGRHHCLKNKPLCRQPGKAGWTDYAICRSHCGHAGGCEECPALTLCAQADFGEVGLRLGR